MPEMCGLYKTLASLSEIISRYDTDLQQQKQYYDALSSQVENSFEESRAYWESLANSEHSSSLELAANTLDFIESQLTYMQGTIDELASLDHAFQSYYNKHHNDSNGVIEEDVSGDADFSLIIRRLADRLREEANACTSTLHTYPFQSIVSRFSRKRKQQYADILRWLSSAEQIANIASEVLPLQSDEYWSSLAQNRDEEIQEAEEESIDLILAISEEKDEVSSDLLMNLRAELDAILPLRLQIGIESYIDSGEIERKEAISKPQSAVPLGYYAIQLENTTHTPEVRRVITEKLEHLISDDVVIVPAMLDAATGVNLSICGEEEGGRQEEAKSVVISLMFSLLSGFPPGYQKFILFDPEERSGSFAPMLRFISQSPEIMGSHILTTAEQMRSALRELNTFVDSIAQRQFVDFPNIFEYNQKMTDKPEPYRTLVIMDFPKYFDEQMLDSLWNIMNIGNPYGVNVMLQYNDSFQNPHPSDSFRSLFKKIEKKAVPLREQDGDWYAPNHVHFFPNVFDDSTFQIFAVDFAKQFRARMERGITLDAVMSADEIGTGDSSEMLSIPIGIHESGGTQYLEFGDKVAAGLSHYALVTGSTGSGKSTLLHTIIMSSVLKYPPDELQIYLLDFKKGTEFKIYADRQIPHIKLLAMDAMQEFGQSILSELCSEMDVRAQMFERVSKSTGVDVKNIIQYRRITNKPLPRLLVIMDEFQLLFDSDANRSVANSCGQMIANLISLARVYGIHFIFATQTLSRIRGGSFTIQTATLNEMHVRIGLKGTRDEAHLLFGDIGGDAAFSKYGEQKGMGAYVSDDTSGVPVGFRAAFCGQDLQVDLLRKIQELYHTVEPATRVFSGSIVPRLETAEEYQRPWENPSCLLLGEPIMIGENIKIPLTNTGRNNLIIMGSSRTTMVQLSELCIRSFYRFFSDGSKLYLLDGEALVGGKTSELLHTNGNSNLYAAESEETAAGYLQQVYKTYMERKQSASRDTKDGIVLFVKDFQWIDTMKQVVRGKDVGVIAPAGGSDTGSIPGLFDFIPEVSVEEEVDRHTNDLSNLFEAFDMEVSQNQQFTKTASASSASAQHFCRPMLMELLEEGYRYGVSCIFTVSDFASFREYAYDLLPKFPNRVIFSMSDADADHIVPEAKIQNLPDTIAVFSNGLNQTCQFKPFSCDLA